MSRLPPKHTGSYIHGHDLSLTSSGIVVLNKNGLLIHSELIKTKSRGMRRLHEIETRLASIMKQFPPTLVCIEDYAKGSKNGMVFNIGELGGVAKLQLYRKGIDYLDVAPKTLKKYVTGNGNAGKPEMKAAVHKNWKFETKSDDLADAYGLAKISQALIYREYKLLTATQKEVIRLLYTNLKAIKR